MTEKRPGPSLRLSIALLVVGVLLGAPAAFMVGRAFFDEVTATAYDAPADLHLHLDHARYTLFERDSGGGRVPVIVASDVHVRPDAGGPEVAVDIPSGTETITRGSTTYQATLEVHVPAAGTYEVRVTPATPTRFLLTRGLVDTLRDVLVWIGLGVVAGMLLVAGIVCLIVGIVRRA